eukprot:Cvel_17787.t1-p1 / transcript=Cvel_17787.t1 / gene=Cvel_17787 / organism=Chromera_velia_CCMP2878 / gene_product=hypothetical protein / transcript_product=hypothetical protein / location=Cvel_scaffold1439:2328-15700(-) / protein_length=3046 / sequence_SO=supercontig / SO=protein_coding / is_pseudo=false
MESPPRLKALPGGEGGKGGARKADTVASLNPALSDILFLDDFFYAGEPKDFVSCLVIFFRLLRKHGEPGAKGKGFSSQEKSSVALSQVSTASPSPLPLVDCRPLIPLLLERLETTNQDQRYEAACALQCISLGCSAGDFRLSPEELVRRVRLNSKLLSDYGAYPCFVRYFESVLRTAIEQGGPQGDTGATLKTNFNSPCPSDDGNESGSELSVHFGRLQTEWVQGGGSADSANGDDEGERAKGRVEPAMLARQLRMALNLLYIYVSLHGEERDFNLLMESGGNSRSAQSGGISDPSAPPLLITLLFEATKAFADLSVVPIRKTLLLLFKSLCCLFCVSTDILQPRNVVRGIPVDSAPAALTSVRRLSERSGLDFELIAPMLKLEEETAEGEETDKEGEGGDASGEEGGETGKTGKVDEAESKEEKEKEEEREINGTGGEAGGQGAEGIAFDDDVMAGAGGKERGGGAGTDGVATGSGDSAGNSRLSALLKRIGASASNCKPLGGSDDETNTGGALLAKPPCPSPSPPSPPPQPGAETGSATAEASASSSSSTKVSLEDCRRVFELSSAKCLPCHQQLSWERQLAEVEDVLRESGGGILGRLDLLRACNGGRLKEFQAFTALVLHEEKIRQRHRGILPEAIREALEIMDRFTQDFLESYRFHSAEIDWLEETPFIRDVWRKYEKLRRERRKARFEKRRQREIRELRVAYMRDARDRRMREREGTVPSPGLGGEEEEAGNSSACSASAAASSSAAGTGGRVGKLRKGGGVSSTVPNKGAKGVVGEPSGLGPRRGRTETTASTGRGMGGGVSESEKAVSVGGGGGVNDADGEASASCDGDAASILSSEAAAVISNSPPPRMWQHPWSQPSATSASLSPYVGPTPGAVGLSAVGGEGEIPVSCGPLSVQERAYVSEFSAEERQAAETEIPSDIDAQGLDMVCRRFGVPLLSPPSRLLRHCTQAGHYDTVTLIKPGQYPQNACELEAMEDRLDIGDGDGQGGEGRGRGDGMASSLGGASERNQDHGADSADDEEDGDGDGERDPGCDEDTPDMSSSEDGATDVSDDGYLLPGNAAAAMGWGASAGVWADGGDGSGWDCERETAEKQKGGGGKGGRPKVQRSARGLGKVFRRLYVRNHPRLSQSVVMLLRILLTSCKNIQSYPGVVDLDRELEACRENEEALSAANSPELHSARTEHSRTCSSPPLSRSSRSIRDSFTAPLTPSPLPSPQRRSPHPSEGESLDGSHPREGEADGQGQDGGEVGEEEAEISMNDEADAEEVHVPLDEIDLLVKEKQVAGEEGEPTGGVLGTLEPEDSAAGFAGGTPGASTPGQKGDRERETEEERAQMDHAKELLDEQILSSPLAAPTARHHPSPRHTHSNAHPFHPIHHPHASSPQSLHATHGHHHHGQQRRSLTPPSKAALLAPVSYGSRVQSRRSTEGEFPPPVGSAPLSPLLRAAVAPPSPPLVGVAPGAGRVRSRSEDITLGGSSLRGGSQESSGVNLVSELGRLKGRSPSFGDDGGDLGMLLPPPVLIDGSGSGSPSAPSGSMEAAGQGAELDAATAAAAALTADVGDLRELMDTEESSAKEETGGEGEKLSAPDASATPKDDEGGNETTDEEEAKESAEEPRPDSAQASSAERGGSDVPDGGEEGGEEGAEGGETLPLGAAASTDGEEEVDDGMQILDDVADRLTPGNLSESSPEYLQAEATKHREILAAAVAGILLILLKRARYSPAPEQFSSLTQLIADSNGALVVLKYLNQDVISGGPPAPPPPGGAQGQQGNAQGQGGQQGEGQGQGQAQGHGQGQNPPGGAVEVLPAQSTPPLPVLSVLKNPNNWVKSGCFPAPNWNGVALLRLLRVLYFLTKDSPERIRKYLVHYKAPFVLRRLHRHEDRETQRVSMKLLKRQMRYLPKKWKQTNMRTVSSVYTCVPTAPIDDWLLFDAFGSLTTEGPNLVDFRNPNMTYNEQLAAVVGRRALRRKYEQSVQRRAKAIGELTHRLREETRALLSEISASASESEVEGGAEALRALEEDPGERREEDGDARRRLVIDAGGAIREAQAAIAAGVPPGTAMILPDSPLLATAVSTFNDPSNTSHSLHTVSRRTAPPVRGPSSASHLQDSDVASEQVEKEGAAEEGAETPAVPSAPTDSAEGGPVSSRAPEELLDRIASGTLDDPTVISEIQKVFKEMKPEELTALISHQGPSEGEQGGSALSVLLKKVLESAHEEESEEASTDLVLSGTAETSISSSSSSSSSDSAALVKTSGQEESEALALEGGEGTDQSKEKKGKKGSRYLASLSGWLKGYLSTSPASQQSAKAAAEGGAGGGIEDQKGEGEKEKEREGGDESPAPMARVAWVEQSLTASDTDVAAVSHQSVAAARGDGDGVLAAGSPPPRHSSSASSASGRSGSPVLRSAAFPESSLMSPWEWLQFVRTKGRIALDARGLEAMAVENPDASLNAQGQGIPAVTVWDSLFAKAESASREAEHILGHRALAAGAEQRWRLALQQLKKLEQLAVERKKQSVGGKKGKEGNAGQHETPVSKRREEDVLLTLLRQHWDGAPVPQMSSGEGDENEGRGGAGGVDEEAAGDGGDAVARGHDTTPAPKGSRGGEDGDREKSSRDGGGSPPFASLEEAAKGQRARGGRRGGRGRDGEDGDGQEDESDEGDGEAERGGRCARQHHRARRHLRESGRDGEGEGEGDDRSDSSSRSPRRDGGEGQGEGREGKEREEDEEGSSKRPLEGCVAEFVSRLFAPPLDPAALSPSSSAMPKSAIRALLDSGDPLLLLPSEISLPSIAQNTGQKSAQVGGVNVKHEGGDAVRGHAVSEPPPVHDIVSDIAAGGPASSNGGAVTFDGVRGQGEKETVLVRSDHFGLTTVGADTSTLFADDSRTAVADEECDRERERLLSQLLESGISGDEVLCLPIGSPLRAAYEEWLHREVLEGALGNGFGSTPELFPFPSRPRSMFWNDQEVLSLYEQTTAARPRFPLCNRGGASGRPPSRQAKGDYRMGSVLSPPSVSMTGSGVPPQTQSITRAASPVAEGGGEAAAGPGHHRMGG